MPCTALLYAHLESGVGDPALEGHTRRLSVEESNERSVVFADSWNAHKVSSGFLSKSILHGEDEGDDIFLNDFQLLTHDLHLIGNRIDRGFVGE